MCITSLNEEQSKVFITFFLNINKIIHGTQRYKKMKYE